MINTLIPSTFSAKVSILTSIDVQKLEVEVNGAGDVNVDGNAGQANLSVNGAGDIDATGLKVAGEVSKHASGMAKIKM